MRLTSDSFANGDPIPATFALGIPSAETHATFGPNRNPHLRWSDVPAGTRSFALICHDSDAPTVADDVNKEGRSVPKDLPRADFFHWILVDIPAGMHEIAEGSVSDGVTPKGKPTGETPIGKTGWNDYTGWFSGDKELKGEYGGYDGPGPPWNDERVHHYTFTVYALDVPKLDLPDSFGGKEARAALTGHVLAQADWIGTYTINPAVQKG